MELAESEKRPSLLQHADNYNRKKVLLCRSLKIDYIIPTTFDVNDMKEAKQS